MKAKRKIIIFVLIILNISIIYYAFQLGKNQSPLTENQLDCFVEEIYEKDIFISQEQAICLAKKEEITMFAGMGYPLKNPKDSAILSLNSKKVVFLENNSADFENQMRKLGVRIFVK